MSRLPIRSERARETKGERIRKKKKEEQQQQQQLSRDSTHHVKSHDNQANRREHQARKQEILQINRYSA